jgi:hypothetical protein
MVIELLNFDDINQSRSNIINMLRGRTRGNKTSQPRPGLTPIGRIPSSPRRSSLQQSNISNYGSLERIDEPFVNPTTPGTPRRTQITQPSALCNVDTMSAQPTNEDTEMAEGTGDGNEVTEPGSPSAGREVAIPITVTLRRAHDNGVKYRQPIKERTWTINYFNIRHLNVIWQKKSLIGEPWFQDRLWTCLYCDDYTSTDSGRHGNISNLNKYLRNNYLLTVEGAGLGKEPKDLRNNRQRGGITSFLRPKQDQLSEEEAFLRFIVQTNQPFSLASHPSLHAVYKSMNRTCQFKDPNTLHTHCNTRFQSVRMEQQSLFDETCQSIAIAFDGWGSQNHKHIIGGVGYWIGKTDWKRYRMVVEFADAKFGKSGEGMAEVLYTSFGEDIVKVDLIESKAGLMERTIKAVGLKINHKVITVCGDNAPNNNTFCDYFH